MRNSILLKLAAQYILIVLCLFACDTKKPSNEKEGAKSASNDSIDFVSGFSSVNGIKLYYEIYGTGEPLVLLHGGGSTIQSSFGRVIPALSKEFKIIAVELQNHGRSDQRSVPETFEQDADDVFALLKNLRTEKATILGFSNGGQTAMQIAISHPEVVSKLIVASSPYKREGFIKGFFDGMKAASLENMPQQLKDEFLKVNPDTAKLRVMFNRDVTRMREFKGWTDNQIKSITAPTLLINGDADVLTPEHAVEMHRMIANSKLAILPGGHGDYMGEITTLGKHARFFDYLTPLVTEFINTK